MLKQTLGLAAAALTLLAGQAFAKTPVAHVTPPIPTTATSHPFGGAANSRVPEDLGKQGYVEEEMFASGQANIYDWGTGEAKVRTANVPYATRILVRRPQSAAKFSGRVVVEMLNPTNLMDLNIGWAIQHAQLVRSGDAWVGITAKPIAVQTLKTFDPARYAALNWSNPLAVTDPANCEVRGDTTKLTENGLVWDINSQVGAWLRSNDASNPFRYGGKTTKVKRLYAWGYSQTGGFLYTYVNVIHPLVMKDDGKPMYDGALIAVAGGPSAVSQCSGALAATDPRRRVKNAGIPVMHVMSGSDYANFAPNRRADSNAKGDEYRDYDIAGSGHATPDELTYGPAPADITKGGQTPPPLGCNEGQRSRFPSAVGFNAILRNLEDWVEKGVVAPPGAVMTMNGNTAALDKHGNMLGGVRSPYVDVPTSTWMGNSTGPSFCRIAGHEKPFDAAKLKQLYGSKQAYVAAVEKSVADLVARRYIVKEDGEAIIREARAFNWPA